MAALDKALTEELLPEEQLVIIDRFWRKDTLQENLGIYKAYLEYYGAETKRLGKGILPSKWLINHMASKTHNDLLGLVEVLSNSRGETLSAVKTLVQALFPKNPPYDDSEIQQSIDLAVRTWLMLNVRDVTLRLHTPNTPTIQWTGGSVTLLDFVSGQFPKGLIENYPPSDSFLDDDFTAAFLSKACGVTFEPTNCLADHLRIETRRERGKTLCRIFSLKKCLVDHIEAAGRVLADASPAPSATFEPSTPVISRGVLEDTIWSLNLLFPINDEDTERFLSEQGKIFHDNLRYFSDEPAEYKRRPLSLNDFHHWRQRLYALRQLYFAEPENVEQYIRKPGSFEKRYQFFIAIFAGFFLALLFGSIQSAFAVISTQATLKALALQQAQPSCIKICPTGKVAEV